MEKDGINIVAEDFREPVPYNVHRDTVVRLEGIVKFVVKGWIITSLILIALCAAIHFSWLHTMNSYDITGESYTIESTDEGNANYLESGNDGEINNGIEGNSKEENND